MGLAEAVLARSNGRADETRAIQVTPWGNWGRSSLSSSGVNVTDENALQLLAVYGCVTLITDTIATLPRKIYRTNPDGTNTEVAQKPRWFEQPNTTSDIIDFLTQSLTSLLLDGNAYWAYSVDLNFAPTEIVAIPPGDVTIDQQGVYFVKGERFVGRLVHIKAAMRAGHLKGMSPIEAAMQSIGLGLAAQQFSGSFYANGTTLSGVIQTPTDLTKTQAELIRDAWSRDHGGLRNAHLPGVLTGGATWQQISVTPEQAQFLQSREFQAAEICSQMFLLDPSMLGLAVGRGQNLTYANLEQRGIHLVQFTLLRWIIRLERAFTFLLPKPQYMKFNVDALMRADLLTRYQAHRIALGPNQAFEAVNEVRALEELPPIPGEDNLPEIAAPAPPQPDTQTNALRDTLEALRAQRAQPIHVAAPDVRIDVAPTPIEVHVAPEAPIVNVTTPEYRIDVPAPSVNVNVEPTPIEMRAGDTHVHVEPTPVEFTSPDVNVNIAPAENHIEVNPTPIEVHPAEVHVAAPDVTVEAAQITVNQPEIRVEPTPIVNEVNVAAADVYVEQPDITVESPIVHVRPPAIRIDAPVINMPKPGKIRRKFERDKNDAILAIIEEPIEDEPTGSPDEGTES